jgi:hypothetical protein
MLIEDREEGFECLLQEMLQTARTVDSAFRTSRKTIGQSRVVLGVAYDFPDADLGCGLGELEAAAAPQRCDMAALAERLDHLHEMALGDTVGDDDLANRTKPLRPQAQVDQDTQGIVRVTGEPHALPPLLLPARQSRISLGAPQGNLEGYILGIIRPSHPISDAFQPLPPRWLPPRRNFGVIRHGIGPISWNLTSRGSPPQRQIGA